MNDNGIITEFRDFIPETTDAQIWPFWNRIFQNSQDRLIIYLFIKIDLNVN